MCHTWKPSVPYRQGLPLVTYSSQHFRPIQYVNGLFKSLLTLQVNNSKINIDLNDFSSFSESMVQQPPIQLSQLITFFYWNENFDYTLMDILENNWDSPSEYVVSLFNTSYNANIT